MAYSERPAVNATALGRFFKNDRFAARSGIKLVSVSPGHARAKMTVRRHHFNAVNTVQGGAIFTLADFAFAAASNSGGAVAVAINVNIIFMKAATSGVLLAEAREVSKNTKLGAYLVEVKDDRGELVAQFQGLAYRKKELIPV